MVRSIAAPGTWRQRTAPRAAMRLEPLRPASAFYNSMLNTGLQPARADRKLHNFPPAITGKKQGAEAAFESRSERSPVVLLREPLAREQITGGFVLAKREPFALGLVGFVLTKTCCRSRPQWFETHRAHQAVQPLPLLHGRCDAPHHQAGRPPNPHSAGAECGLRNGARAEERHPIAILQNAES